VTCGIKNPEATRLDLALIVSDGPTVTDAVFTTNKVRAACVRVCQQHIKESDTRAIIANSGNANACTGVQGIQDAKAMTKAVGRGTRRENAPGARLLHRHHRHAMPIERITPKVADAVAKLHGNGSAAMRAIMTSDTQPKTFAVEVPCGKGSFRIGGIAKGAGMICPNMATMLCFITTDAKDRQGRTEAQPCATPWRSPSTASPSTATPARTTPSS
jgi:glutamate N-acetyltransferase/amino-acid N-acetyltransferase